MSYPLGQPVHLTFATYSDTTQTNLADPTQVTLTVTNSAGIAQTYTWQGGAQVIRDGLGLFHYDYVPARQHDDYTFLWEATGAVVTSDDGTFSVRAAVAWRPDTSDVAAYIPERTVTLTAPGQQQPVGDFTTTTTPTNAQAESKIDIAMSYLTMRVGTVTAQLYDQAKDAAAMRAAGLIELSYPTRQDDLNVGDRWIKLADNAIDALLVANSNPGASPPAGLLPSYSFPDPPYYGDTPL